MRQFPAELYAEFFAEMLDVYTNYKDNKIEMSKEIEDHLITSLFLWGGVRLTHTDKASILMKEEIIWQ